MQNNFGKKQNLTKIPEWEVDFRADRSSGPGGQNVNKTATKITLFFNIDASKKLDPEKKRIIKSKLKNVINKDGEIVISEQGSRSQLTNRQAAMKKLNDMIVEALIPEKERKETKTPKREKEKRLIDKKTRSEVKKNRKVLSL